MAVIAIFQGPTLTQASYEASVKKLTGGKKIRMEATGDWPVPGLLIHAAGQGPNGFRVVDVWESEAAFQKFGEKLMPIMKELGIQGNPEVYPAHAFVSA
jgi:hypothetical protein